MMQQGLFTAERNSRPEKIDVAYLLLMVLMTGLGFVALYINFETESSGSSKILLH